MANVLKYKTSQPTKRALRKGNVALGLGEENYGPSSTTGYYSGIDVPEGGYVVYTLGANNNPKAFVASSDADLPAIARTLGGGRLTILQSKNYLQTLANTWVLDSLPKNKLTDGLRLNLDARVESSFLDNQPITNLQPYPTMLPNVTGSIIISSATYDSNVGGSNWGWSYYPNSNISPDGGMEWHPNVIDPLGNNGAWLMKKRPGGNSESNWTTTPPGAIDQTKSYTVSVWCKTNQANCFRIHINTTQNGSSYWGYASSYHSGGGEWERLSLTIPANSGNTSINVVRCQAIYTNITADAYYKYYQVEEGDTPTDFVDGTRSQNTTWYDLSGYGNNFTPMVSMSFTGHSFDFNGIDSGVQDHISSYNPDGADSVLECLFKPMDLSRAQAIFSDNYGPEFGFWIHANGQMYGIAYAQKFANVEVGRWYHAVLNIDPGATKSSTDQTYVQLYVNGEYKGQNNANTGNGMNDQPFTLGYDYRSGSPTAYFSGSIAVASVYYGQFTQDEVNTNYYGGPIVTDGLVLAVDAGNLVSYESGSTTTYNLTGSLSGSLLNGVSYTDLFGGSFDFDGTDDYISTEPFDMGTPTDITLECWIRFNGTLDSNDRKVMHYDKTGTTNAVFQLRKGTTNSQLMYQAHNGTQWYTMTDIDAIEANTWAHFTITHAGTSAVMYKNGVQSATATMGNLDWTNANNLLIGYRAASEYWKGNIAIMRIYNRALSSDEVLQNFNAQKARFDL